MIGGYPLIPYWEETNVSRLSRMGMSFGSRRNVPNLSNPPLRLLWRLCMASSWGSLSSQAKFSF
jgi:hypothetical protein